MVAPMEEGLAARALARLRLPLEEAPIPLSGSMSRSSVVRLRLVAGPDAVLKVTGAGQGQTAARRELDFYLTLADTVPVATPRLLAHVDDGELTALVLSLHAPGPPASAWELPRWLDLARELAALHSTPIAEVERWLQPAWLERVLENPPIDRAWSYWAVTRAADAAAAALGALAEVRVSLDTLPRCLTHGDCNVDNLLREAGHTVWIDWPGVGIGPPALDLAFLWGTFWARRERIPPDPPRHRIIDAYAAERGVDATALWRSAVAAELGMTLFGWPGWALGHGQAEQDRTARRLVELAGEWAGS